jgi:hypothetical protein
VFPLSSNPVDVGLPWHQVLSFEPVCE